MHRDSLGVLHPSVSSIKVQDSAYQPRIACLVPSITELLFALDLGRWIVARTGYCIHPKGLVDAIPKVGGTKVVNFKKLRQLAPTHVIVNMEENTKQCVDELRTFVPHIIITHPVRILDNIQLYQLLGAIFDCVTLADEWVDRLKATVNAAAALSKTADISVLYLIWQDPWMTISPDTYIADVLAHAGLKSIDIRDLAGVGGSPRYPSFDWPALAAYPFDAVLLSSEPFSFTQTDADVLQDQLARAGRQVPCMLIDGEMTSWYGSRAVQSLPYLITMRRQIEQRLPI